MNDEIKMEERYVGFIDILGFREKVKEEKDIEIINLINELNNIKNKLKNTKVNVIFENKSSCEEWNINVSNFSDSMVISSKTLDYIVISSISIMSELLKIGILTRGAIIRGKIYHTGNIVVGQGFIDAYDMERKLAKYPRIILSEDIIYEVENSRLKGVKKDIIKQDKDGLYFLQHLFMFVEKTETIKSVFNGISTELEKCEINAEKYCKIIWLKNELNEQLNSLKNEYKNNPKYQLLQEIEEIQLPA